MTETKPNPIPEVQPQKPQPVQQPPQQFSGEINGQQGPEPTRYGDWEKGGRCTDF